MGLLLLQGCGLDMQLVSQPSRVTLAEQVPDQPTLPGSYIVAFRAPSGLQTAGFHSFRSEYQTLFLHLQQPYFNDPRVQELHVLTAIDLEPAYQQPEAFQELNLTPYLFNDLAPSAPKTGVITRVDFHTPEDAAQALLEWEMAGDLWFAEPNYVSRLRQEDANVFSELDTAYKTLIETGLQDYWWLTSINLNESFQALASRDQNDASIPTDAEMVADKPIIAILDSGVDYNHPALAGRIWVNQDVNAARCKNDIHGCNTTKLSRGSLGNGDVFPYDTSGPGINCFGRDSNCSHGTHVAGIVVGDHTWRDAELGRAAPGVCPICQVMILKIVSKVGDDSGILDSSIIGAFKYVGLFRRSGSSAVRIINASFGKFIRSRSVGLLVRLMKEKNGTLVIGAAGNEDTNTQEFPAAFSDAIAVSAVDRQLRKVSFSNFGRWVDIAAPGSGILSTVPGEAVDLKSGTSMAAPMVAATAGLMLARFPNISYDDLKFWITQSADPAIYSPTSGDRFNYDNYYPKVPQDSARQPLLGIGLLNANTAVRKTPSGNLPLFSNLDRVGPGCGRIGEKENPKRWWGLLVFLGMGVLGTYSLNVTRAILRKRRRGSRRLPANNPS